MRKILSLVLLGLLCSIGNVWGATETIDCSGASATGSTGNTNKHSSTNYTAYFTRGGGGWSVNSGKGYQGKTDAIAVFKLTAPTNVKIILSNSGSSERTFTVTAKPFKTIALGDEFISILEVSNSKPAKYADCVSSSKNYAELETTSAFYNTSPDPYCTLSNSELSSSLSYTTGEKTLAASATSIEYEVSSSLPAGVYAIGFSAVSNANVSFAGLKFTPIGDDKSAPVLESAVPVNGATKVATSGNIVLTFDENIALASGYEFTLKQGETTVKTWSAATTAAAVSGKTITLAYSGLAGLTSYSLYINNANKITDTAATPNEMSSISLPSFTTEDPSSSEITISWAYDDNGATTAPVYSSGSSFFTAGTVTLGSNVSAQGTDHCFLNTSSESDDQVNFSKVKTSDAGSSNTVLFSATIADGLVFVPSSVSFVASKFGTNNAMSVDAIWISEGEEDVALGSKTLKRAVESSTYAKPGGDRFVCDLSSCPSASGTFGLKLALTTSGKNYGIGDIVITGTLAHIVTLTENVWASFCPSMDVTILAEDASNVSVSYATYNSLTQTLTTHKCNESEAVKIKAGEGVLLKANSSGAKEFLATTSASNIAGNDLSGTTAVTATDRTNYTYYVLANGDYGIGFYRYDNASLPANKAYLKINGAYSSAPAIRFEEENATSIHDIERGVEAVKFIENGQLFIRKDGVVYDTMGRVIR